MPNDVSKLPKWAQERIQWLERENVRLARKLDQLEGTEETNITYLDGLGERPLPANKTIRFQTDDGHIDVRLERPERGERGGICINAEHPMSIRPEAANAAKIYNEER